MTALAMPKPPSHVDGVVRDMVRITELLRYLLLGLGVNDHGSLGSSKNKRAQGG